MKAKLILIIAVMWIGTLGWAVPAITVDPNAQGVDSVITVNRVRYGFLTVWLPQFVPVITGSNPNYMLKRGGVEAFVAPRIAGYTVAKDEQVVIAGDTTRFNPFGNYLEHSEGHIDTAGGRHVYVWDTVQVIPAALSFDSLKR